MRGFILFHFLRSRKFHNDRKVIISHPKDSSLFIPSFLLGDWLQKGQRFMAEEKHRDLPVDFTETFL